MGVSVALIESQNIIGWVELCNVCIGLPGVKLASARKFVCK